MNSPMTIVRREDESWSTVSAVSVPGIPSGIAPARTAAVSAGSPAAGSTVVAAVSESDVCGERTADRETIREFVTTEGVVGIPGESALGEPLKVTVPGGVLPDIRSVPDCPDRE